MAAGNNEVDDLTLARGDFLIERHIATAMPAAHWHDHVELNLLLEGEMTYLFNGRREEVEAGRLVLFWAAIPHQTITITITPPLNTNPSIDDAHLISSMGAAEMLRTLVAD